MPTQTTNHEATTLKDDEAIYKREGGRAPESVHHERRVALALFAHLEGRGFRLEAVHDGEETCKVATDMEALEVMYSVGDSTLYFRKEGGRRHWALWICGNGKDNPSDYGSYEEDGWNAAMELSAFDPDTVL